MSQASSLVEIDYPESDGRPMGETDLHRWWMIRIYDLLKYRYRDEDVYVGSDLLLYYVEGDIKKFVVPDDFVVLDSKSEFRRIFKIWTEQRVPNVVFEVTSRKTRRHDERTKPNIYANIGVKELFLYDPTLDYLNPALQGYRLVEGQYVPLSSNGMGALECRELGLLLRLDRERLVIQDAATREPLLTEAEALEEELAAARKEAAELRFKLMELENERLRQQLRQRGEQS